MAKYKMIGGPLGDKPVKGNLKEIAELKIYAPGSEKVMGKYIRLDKRAFVWQGNE